MTVNICSSPSSGSTLLATILDGHPDITCGAKLTFLAKPVLYTDYDYFR